jgi:hypothetical protein
MSFVIPSKPTEEQIRAAEHVYNRCASVSPTTPVEQDDICILHEYMDDFQIPSAAITRLLLATGAIIAGSFPLQAVLRKRWNESDMDIYMSTNSASVEQWHGLLTAFGYKLRLGRGQSYITWRNARLHGAIDEVRSYELCASAECVHKIQVISCNSVPCVLNAVDLSCTTIRYDGQRLVALEDMDLIRCKIAYRRFPLDKLTAHEATERILKYTKRGMIVLNYERKSPYTEWAFADLICEYVQALDDVKREQQQLQQQQQHIL